MGQERNKLDRVRERGEGVLLLVYLNRPNSAKKLSHDTKLLPKYIDEEDVVLLNNTRIDPVSKEGSILDPLG